mgnify:CR=1 FL=1
MAGLNKIMVIGNLGSDPEMRYTPNGAPVTSFSVATNRTYTTSQGERRDETEWFRIVAWNQLAETCNQFLKKGSSVYAEGRLRTDSWTSKEGEPRFTNEIVANQVVFLDKRSDNMGGPESNDTPQTDNAPQSDNLPW